MYLESYPRDHDPYTPGKLNYFRSHYNRLGVMPDEPLQSETSRMLSELYEKEVPKPEINKYLINFYSYSKFVIDITSKPCFITFFFQWMSPKRSISVSFRPCRYPLWLQHYHANQLYHAITLQNAEGEVYNNYCYIIFFPGFF